MRMIYAMAGLVIALGLSFVRAEAPWSYAGQPFHGKPTTLPAKIKATEYDISPESKNDVSFHYNGAIRKTDIRKTPDGIGLGRFAKDHVNIKGEPEPVDQTYLGWTHAGEWTKYTLDVKDAGTYSIGLHCAAGGKDGTISFTFSPDMTTGPISIPTTAGYQPKVEVYHVWQTLDDLAEVKLPAGEIVMTMKIEKSGGFNIESITLTKK